MDIEALRTFVDVMRSGGIGKSAQRMHLTQSAVSRRIQVLESALGVKLFAPKGRGIEPTQVGHKALPHAEAAMAAIDQLQTVADRVVPDVVTLRLAATPQTIETMVAPAMAAIKQERMRLSLIEAGAAEVVDLILSDACDCGFTSHPALESGLKSETVGALKLYVAHPDLTDGQEMELKKLKGREIVALDRSFQSRQVLDASLQLAKITPNIAYEGKSTRAILALAEHRQGIAVLPSNVSTSMPTALLLFGGKPLEISSSLVWRAVGPVDQTALKLVELFKTQRTPAQVATQSA